MSDENTESPSSADPSTVTQRVKEIRDLMLSGQWKTGSTSYGLALRWGISEYTVRKHANEASRQIESAFEDKSDLRAKVYLLLERAIDCAEEARPTAPEKAAKILVDVGRQFSRMAGLEAPTKLDVTVASGVKLTEMSVEDLRAIARGEQPPGAGSSTP